MREAGRKINECGVMKGRTMRKEGAMKMDSVAKEKKTWKDSGGFAARSNRRICHCECHPRTYPPLPTGMVLVIMHDSILYQKTQMYSIALWDFEENCLSFSLAGVAL